ncbi:phosphoglycerate mutase [Anaerobacterium chartisolvens]|uniref:Phosphoglycerate mutase n=1 Tax=Anaerobacterium chartisolvens TaxID=1297424 RepID=A0A369BAF8_9FIRM|nr:peptidase [Anaerobacterium chartisolvens]RCX18305.1 phosphoglycerate mutase [Anaerobacterium chartisolvens]
MRMIFIFIDGLGLGKEDKTVNPLYAAKAPNIHYILERFTVIPTDATLGVKGLPQSATGQTAIFTGENAPRILGRHLNGQPTETLKNIIYKNNLFMQLGKMGLRVTNSNVYSTEYLQKMVNPHDRRLRPSVTSVMTMVAGMGFRTVDDYRSGRGVYHDITGHMLIERGYDVERITPRQAAERLYSISRENDFTLYEHFMTDIIGHKMDMELAIKEIELLDEFLGELAGLVDLNEDIIFITSDHGNIEDISVKTHTYNKVPTIIMGNMHRGLGVKIESLMDITPAVTGIFKEIMNNG